MGNGCAFTLLWLQHQNFLKAEQMSNDQTWFCHQCARPLAYDICSMDTTSMGDSLDLTQWIRVFRKGPVTLEPFSSLSQANGLLFLCSLSDCICHVCCLHLGG